MALTAICLPPISFLAEFASLSDPAPGLSVVTRISQAVAPSLSQAQASMLRLTLEARDRHRTGRYLPWSLAPDHFAESLARPVRSSFVRQ
jgi:hypothetical protein